jgi:hypothetical protein
MGMLIPNVVYVASYFDDEEQLPWDYVRVTDDGKAFEAITMHVVEALQANEVDEAREHTVGIFEDRGSAIKALDAFRRQVELAEDRPIGDDGFPEIDFNLRIH